MPFGAPSNHFQREGYECIPNLLLLYVPLAHLTKNIKLGCGFNVAPMWHPLRLAEDFATADILTRWPGDFRPGPGLPQPGSGHLRRSQYHNRHSSEPGAI